MMRHCLSLIKMLLYKILVDICEGGGEAKSVLEAGGGRDVRGTCVQKELKSFL